MFNCSKDPKHSVVQITMESEKFVLFFFFSLQKYFWCLAFFEGFCQFSNMQLTYIATSKRNTFVYLCLAFTAGFARCTKESMFGESTRFTVIYQRRGGGKLKLKMGYKYVPPLRPPLLTPSWQHHKAQVFGKFSFQSLKIGEKFSS